MLRKVALRVVYRFVLEVVLFVEGVLGVIIMRIDLALGLSQSISAAISYKETGCCP